MWPFRKKKILVTHSGNFHADDVFAAATLSILLKNRVKIIRTRDEEKIARGDFVFDVGGIYDAKQNRFDHHQKSGAGARENGISYASFGLVWQSYGEKVAGSRSVAEFIDKKIVAPIDAIDNGISLSDLKFSGIYPYDVSEALHSFVAMPGEKKINNDKEFLKAVEFAKKLLSREILKAKSQEEAYEGIKQIYAAAADKRLIIFEKNSDRRPLDGVVNLFPEPLFVVAPRKEDWIVIAVREDVRSFKNRKDLPREWGGLVGQELAGVTGVPDAMFCHNNLFLATAKSREGAIRLAELALQA